MSVTWQTPIRFLHILFSKVANSFNFNRNFEGTLFILIPLSISIEARYRYAQSTKVVLPSWKFVMVVVVLSEDPR